MAEYIIYLVIMCLTALVMIGIGVSQLKSRKPVGFFTGVKLPEEKELRDVEAWNRKHGIMWILYGCVLIACGFVPIAGAYGCDDVLLLIVELVIIIGGIFAMMLYHVRLEKMYRR